MTCLRRLASATAVAACASILVLPASAGAANVGEASFQQVYPAASGLCARVSAGTANPRKLRYASEVLADCALLQSTYTSATTAVLAARAALTPPIAADETTLAAACPARHDHTRACDHARVVVDPGLAALRRQKAAAVDAYYASIEAGRKRFWDAIDALPGVLTPSHS